MIKLLIFCAILYFAYIYSDQIHEYLSFSTTNKVEGAFNDMTEASGSLSFDEDVQKDAFIEEEIKLLAEERKRVTKERTRIAIERFKNGIK